MSVETAKVFWYLARLGPPVGSCKMTCTLDEEQTSNCLKMGWSLDQCWACTEFGGLELPVPVLVTKHWTGIDSDFWNLF
jgi:hypothetical protein